MQNEPESTDWRQISLSLITENTHDDINDTKWSWWECLCNLFFRLHKSERLKACSRLSCGWVSVERVKDFYEEWMRINVSILRHPVELHNSKVTIRFPLTRPHMHTHTDLAAYLSIIAFHHKMIQTKVCKRERKRQRGRHSQTQWLCSKTCTNIG